MKIAVQLIYTSSWNTLASIVIPNVKAYCKKHGYLCHIVEYHEPCPSDFGFNKFEEIKYLFALGEADIVFSLDMDTLITNHTVKVEGFIKGNNSFWVCNDHNGINAGSFIIQKSEWSNNFIPFILSQRKLVNCEQDAIVEWINKKEDPRITLLSHPSINSYLYQEYPENLSRTEKQGQWQEGNFILHLAGMGMDKRFEIFNEYKDRIIYE